ncbi:hypothetical protein OG992_33625 [Micromonospora sp. NBC_00362]|uniref:hypothetical protein n=1 Tax=Micromonospora sp. NBC_00362 TaxID=2975975 RepID=UPI002254BDC2|nr:hypothetical protein [Micromonospora sp. NBC_00362]MCX5122099.1 hypothetical protein [Micromonospora sp. NBC_00362]
MTSNKSSATLASAGMVGARSDQIARILLGLAALGALAAAASAAGAVGDADASSKIVETWRAYGLVVFAGLFTLLAAKPRGYRGVWELVIFHKVALTVTALVYAAEGGVIGTASIIVWDGAVSVLLIAAYVLSRGWAAPSGAQSASRHRG